ncbi:hypothetical protein NDR87_24065 [Nocardia sp. CDC159]|uniref:Uncharacterized protein n=1 Tax=Nocardia pulmonis TaxID=2951408 RepID=A0A9X2J1H8_9NOCA|nr:MULTISPECIES: hypothetical protein [Nocardia]MCM6777026.1 hypothetical protein [Nocardia pulmonis]MCM6789450.1 hypothetical protein [Nocardia sp. CDC159]
MSQHPATRRRTDGRRRTQILQYTAIVAAGMASIGLTVAAGTYVVNQIAATGRMPGTEIALPGTGLAEREPDDERGGHESARTARLSGEIGLVAEAVRLPFTPLPGLSESLPAAAPTPTTAATTGMPQAGPAPVRLRLPGDTYVGANVTRPQPDSLTMTVDTNVLAAVTTALAHQLGAQAAADPAGITRISTDIDTRSGEITVALSDPLLGRQSMQLHRPPV